MLMFLRRKGLGAGSVRGMLSYMNGIPVESIRSVTSWQGTIASVVRNDRITNDSSLTLIRWGCTTISNVPLAQQWNTSSAIRQVNQKKDFRMQVQSLNPSLVPQSWTNPSDLSTVEQSRRLIWRPNTHAQGRNLVVGDKTTLGDRLTSGGYVQELIDKVAEYRVYVVSGRVATVARKTPADPSAVAWNVAQGGRFDVVNWGDWPLEVCRVAVESFKLTSLDFGGVDVMVDSDGRAYMIEINSAPSLPLLSDGSVSYRQKCMAKCFMYGRENIPPIETYNGWRDVIHPAVWERGA